MKFKKLISLSLTMIISAGILVGCGSSDGDSATEGKIKVGMITDVGGVHDESFNQSSWEGLQAIQKELGKDKLDVKVSDKDIVLEGLGYIKVVGYANLTMYTLNKKMISVRNKMI